MTQSAAAVEVRLSCRVGTTGLATVRHHPQHPEMIRVAVGASVRFTIAEADAAAVRDAIERARYWGHGSTPLTSEIMRRTLSPSRRPATPPTCGRPCMPIRPPPPKSRQ